jgi:hypothetical protein
MIPEWLSVGRKKLLTWGFQSEIISWPVGPQKGVSNGRSRALIAIKTIVMRGKKRRVRRCHEPFTNGL